MFIDSTLRLTIYLASSVISAILIIFFLIKARKGPLLYSYIWLQSIVLFWSVHVILLNMYSDNFLWSSRYSGNFSLYQFIFKYLLYIGYYNACFIGLGWLLFCITFTRFSVSYQNLFILLLFIPPSAMYLFVIRNNIIPNLYSLGSFLSLIPALQYLYCAAGLILLVKYAVKQKGYIKRQAIFIFAAGLIPIVIRLAQDYKLFVLHTGRIFINFDPTPVGFTIAMLIIAFMSYKYRFLNYVPFALKKLAANMNQSIVVLGEANEILFFNRAFSDLFRNNDAIAHLENLSALTRIFKEAFEESSELSDIIESIHGEASPCHTSEVILKGTGKKYLSVNIQPLISKNSISFGRIITFTDVTEYRNLLNELNDKNNELTAMNQELIALNSQLEQNAAIEKELAITKERNRFARDVHDTLGHTMTVLITLLKVSSINCEKDPGEARKNIQDALNIAKGGLKELRHSISGISPEKLVSKSFTVALRNLVHEFEVSGMNVDLSVDSMEEFSDTIYSGTIFRICQEAMTNSLRHGNAKNITLVVRLVSNHIKLFITDDGRGCKDIKKGFGLFGMEQRVVELGGSFKYGSDGECGFNIYVDFPMSGGLKTQTTPEG